MNMVQLGLLSVSCGIAIATIAAMFRDPNDKSICRMTFGMAVAIYFLLLSWR